MFAKSPSAPTTTPVLIVVALMFAKSPSVPTATPVLIVVALMFAKSPSAPTTTPVLIVVALMFAKSPSVPTATPVLIVVALRCVISSVFVNMLSNAPTEALITFPLRLSIVASVNPRLPICNELAQITGADKYSTHSFCADKLLNHAKFELSVLTQPFIIDALVPIEIKSAAITGALIEICTVSVDVATLFVLRPSIVISAVRIELAVIAPANKFCVTFTLYVDIVLINP